jgi:heterodisulfide reductase subunit A-like polyferredoxin
VTPEIPLDSPKKTAVDALPVLIEGGGAAGISAGLDLAAAGRSVHLIERTAMLGGQVLRLDKIYPTDHCAFCPLWTDIRRLQGEPGITVHLSSVIASLEASAEGNLATIVTKPPFIAPERCISCGKCAEACPLAAARPLGEHVYPPSFRIDEGICDHCGRCVGVCPTAAIDLTRKEERKALKVGKVIRAAGFAEADLKPLPEFGYGLHPDIMTSLEFEAWTAEAGQNGGRIVRKSGGGSPANIAFIQCSGARDERLLPWCSAVCCMHALKQSSWVKRRDPGIDCWIFYTDLRTVGRDYYAYSQRAVDEAGVRLVRGRPGLIHPLPGGGIAVKFEDTLTQKREIRRFDMVVLNGNLRPSVGDGYGADAEPPADACGFAAEPADAAQSACQGSSAAMKVLIGEREGSCRA